MILITGAAGYIGSHIIYELQKKYHTVGIDNFSNSSNKIITKLKKLDKKNNFIFYQTDCVDYSSLKKIFKFHKIEIIINCAALKNVNESMRRKKKYRKNNLEILKNILKLMKLYKIKNIIHCSTAALYDDRNKMPLKEKSKLKSISVYSDTKRKNEKQILNFKKKNGQINYFILRFFNPIGLNKKLILFNELNNRDLLANIKRSVLQNKKLKIYGNKWPTRDGTCIRDFFDIKDLVFAFEKLIYKIIKKKINKSCILNLGSGKDYTILEFIKLFEQVNKVKIQVAFTPPLKYEVFLSIASIEKAKKILSWYPKNNIRTALKTDFKYLKKI